MIQFALLAAPLLLVPFLLFLCFDKKKTETEKAEKEDTTTAPSITGDAVTAPTQSPVTTPVTENPTENTHQGATPGQSAETDYGLSTERKETQAEDVAAPSIVEKTINMGAAQSLMLPSEAQLMKTQVEPKSKTQMEQEPKSLAQTQKDTKTKSVAEPKVKKAVPSKAVRTIAAPKDAGKVDAFDPAYGTLMGSMKMDEIN